MGVYRDLYCPVCRKKDSSKLYRSRILNGENYHTPTWLNVEILGLMPMNPELFAVVKIAIINGNRNLERPNVN